MALSMLKGEFDSRTDYMIKIHRKEGWILNPNDKLVNVILKMCENNDGNCPCDNKGRDTKCPCSDYLEEDNCHCNLYINNRAQED